MGSSDQIFHKSRTTKMKRIKMLLVLFLFVAAIEKSSSWQVKKMKMMNVTHDDHKNGKFVAVKDKHTKVKGSVANDHTIEYEGIQTDQEDTNKTSNNKTILQQRITSEMSYIPSI